MAQISMPGIKVDQLNLFLHCKVDVQGSYMSLFSSADSGAPHNANLTM